MDPATLSALLLACAPQVDAGTAQAIVAVESGFNPHAIGVVGGTLERQPRTRAEAIATAASLQAKGWNFSVGLGQINVHNFERLGLTPATAFDPCLNLQAMQAVLFECRARTIPDEPAQIALRQALSCYYSGSLSAVFGDGYVRRVAHAVAASRPARVAANDSDDPKPLTDPSRRY